ncbi:MAG: alpha/beta hydrolase [Nakamurella sp.]
MPEGTASQRSTFDASSARLNESWPAPAEQITLSSDFGNTVVHVSGRADAPALVLLPAYQASSAEWIALARSLNGALRVYAVDLIGDAGGSTAGSRAIASPQDIVSWLDTVLDGLGLPTAALGGHSYGAWIADEYAQHRPDRVGRLILLDPTMVFGTLLPSYVVRAMPFILRPTPGKRRWLIRWETRKIELDPDWLEMTAAAAEVFAHAPTVPTKIPAKTACAKTRVPTLVIIAEKSRVHSARRVAGRAAKLLPNGEVQMMKGASHYGLPMTHAAEVAALITSPRSPAPPFRA